MTGVLSTRRSASDVADVLVRYATGIDRRDWAAVPDLLHRRIARPTTATSVVWRSAEEITTWMRDVHEPVRPHDAPHHERGGRPERARRRRPQLRRRHRHRTRQPDAARASAGLLRRRARPDRRRLEDRAPPFHDGAPPVLPRQASSATVRTNTRSEMRAVVLRGGRLEVRETADPVPGEGELLLRTLSHGDLRVGRALHGPPRRASPTAASAGMVYDADRDIVLGHEFVGEVVGHGPGCSDQFPIGTRVTAMPILLVDGGARRHQGDRPAPRGPGQLRRAARRVRDDGPRRARRRRPTTPSRSSTRSRSASSTCAARGSSPARSRSSSAPARSDSRAVAALAARGIDPIIVSDFKPDRLAPGGAVRRPRSRRTRPSGRRSTCGRSSRSSAGAPKPAVVFECVGRARADAADRRLAARCGRGSSPPAAGTPATRSTARQRRTRVSPSSSAAAPIPRTGTAPSTPSATAGSTRSRASAGSSVSTRFPMHCSKPASAKVHHASSSTPTGERRARYATTTRTRPRFWIRACGVSVSPWRWVVTRSAGKYVPGVGERVRGREREAVGGTVDVGFDEGILGGPFEVPFGRDDRARARRNLDERVEGDPLTRRDLRPARTVRGQVDHRLDALAGLRRRRHFDLAVDEFEVGAGGRDDVVLDPVRRGRAAPAGARRGS